MVGVTQVLSIPRPLPSFYNGRYFSGANNYYKSGYGGYSNYRNRYYPYGYYSTYRPGGYGISSLNGRWRRSASLDSLAAPAPVVEQQGNESPKNEPAFGSPNTITLTPNEDGKTFSFEVSHPYDLDTYINNVREQLDRELQRFYDSISPSVKESFQEPRMDLEEQIKLQPIMKLEEQVKLMPEIIIDSESRTTTEAEQNIELEEQSELKP